LLSTWLIVCGYAQAFEDPTQVAAAMSEKMLMSPLIAVAMAGERTVAVGQRGHIALSENGGHSWKQAQVPVSSDLVAVSFPTAQHGWAVGHGGVVLHSKDGGLTWERQLDGHQASTLILEYYTDKARGGALENAQLFIDREQSLIGYGGTQPLMAVHFLDEKIGFVVGLFNRILKTVDGGKTWEPWLHRVDNPNELHFYSLSDDARALYITGEQGMVWRMGLDEMAFAAIPTDYAGTLFGAASNGKSLIAFGMRGSVFRSTDEGANWVRTPIDSQAGITAGVFLLGGHLLLTSLAGEVELSTDEGQSFTRVQLKKSMPFFDLVARVDGNLTLVGATGVQRETMTLLAIKTKESSAVVERSADQMSTLLGAGYGYRH
jgi:photosystem II stability/assembly factor-like uncharacterized protein